jgi:hypothetical protein
MWTWIHMAQDMIQSCEHGNKPSGPLKCGEFLGYLSVC